MDYLNASDALNMLAGRKHRDDGHAAQLLGQLQPNDHEILKRAGLTPGQFSEGIDLDDAELLQSAIYQAKQQQVGGSRRITPPLPPNSSFAYDPNIVEIPTNKNRVLRVPKDSLLGQNWAVEPQISSASPIAARTQDADFYLPMNMGLHEDYAAPGVTALTKLNAFLEGDRTSTIRKNRQGQAVARQAQPGQTIRFFDDYGSTGLAKVTAPGQRIDQEIFTGDIPQATAVRGGPAQYIDENFIKQRVAAGDSNWDIIEPDDYPTAYGYQTDKGFVNINDPSPFPQLTRTDMTPAREAMMKLGLTEGQNETGIKRTLFGGENNRGIGGSGSVINYEVIPGTRIDVSQLPPTQQYRIGELQNREDYLTDGEGFVGYKDNAIEWRNNPVFNGGVEMLAGAEKYDPVIAGWLEGNQVNVDSKYLTPAQIKTRQAVKSRWEDGKGWVERPITQSIQNLKPGVSPSEVNKALDWGENTSKFYQPAVTQEMLDAGLPRESQMMTADEAIRAIDTESKNQLAQRNLESIDVYNKPADMRPPGNGYGNYNLTFKYANTSDQMGLNDAYNQQWQDSPPDIYTHYTGGPLRYNDAGVGVDFGQSTYQNQKGYIGENRSAAGMVRGQDKLSLSPVRFDVEPELTGYNSNVELAQGIRNTLPVSETYTSAPLWASADPREPKRNIVPLQPEVADIPTMEKQQELLRQHLNMETPKPLGEGTYKGRPMQTTGVTMGQMPAVSGVIPGAYLQEVDEQGNLAWEKRPKQMTFNTLDVDTGEQNVITGDSPFGETETKPKLTPYTPSSDLNQRSNELSRVMIQSGNSYIPYVGVAGEPLMYDKLTKLNDNQYLQKVSDTELVRDPDTMPDSLEKIRQLRDSSRNQLAQGKTIEASPNVRSRSSNAGAQSFETNTIPGLQWPIGDIGEYEPTPISSLADYHIEKNKLLSNINNAQPYLGDVISRDRTQILQAPFNENPVILNQPSSRRAYAGADADRQLADSIESTYKALGTIDPEMNIDRERFNVGVKMAEGQSTDKIASLLQQHGIEPVVEGQTVTGQGELSVEKRAELARGLRRNLMAPEVPDMAIGNDPEAIYLRDQWRQQRADVMGKTADQLRDIQQLYGQRRLDKMGRPMVDEGRQAVNKMASAIENANYEGDDMRPAKNYYQSHYDLYDDSYNMDERVSSASNLSFYDDDFTGETVHPLDRVQTQPITAGFSREQSRAGYRATEFDADPFLNTGSARPVSWQVAMAEAMPDAGGGYEWMPSSSEPVYTGQQRAVRTPGGQMTYTPPPFEFDPSQAEPTYTGRGRPAPGGGMNYAPQPAAVNNPWYRTKPGMIGLGGAALGLGALAYSHMQRKQAEEDLRSQQLMAMTGWR